MKNSASSSDKGFFGEGLRTYSYIAAYPSWHAACMGMLYSCRDTSAIRFQRCCLELYVGAW